jgi:hypothetical protein
MITWAVIQQSARAVIASCLGFLGCSSASMRIQDDPWRSIRELLIREWLISQSWTDLVKRISAIEQLTRLMSERSDNCQC